MEPSTSEIEEVSIDWSQVKQRFEFEGVITEEFLENRTWIYEPHGRLDHQLLLVKIVDARIYCYLAVVLHVYEQQLFTFDEQALTRIQDRINKVILVALNLVAYKDFLMLISSELMFGNMSDVDHTNDILAKVRTKANGTLNELNGASTNEIDRLSFNFDENQLSTNDMIMKIIKDFEDYLKELKRFLPFDYNVLLNFIGMSPYSSLFIRSRLS
ncbi:uncharacterized protein LOC126839501 [Adelges cooleyi]|uniref:uncharacterized protein LOC126839501 n=1 Tax=Adelges cooleyi TaxID=133065 RepID=UPI00217F8E39|nr:uncharacterized protein LOC126839501 [Adelges cooleyi]